jgi:hypothetical protein
VSSVGAFGLPQTQADADPLRSVSRGGYEGSDNLSNGGRQRDDGSEGVANSDQIVDVHLFLAGGDGRSLMPPKGYTIKASRRLAQFPGQPVG